MMIPARYDPVVVRGDTWRERIEYRDDDGTPIDLTGYQARMDVRLPSGRWGTTTATTLVASYGTSTGHMTITGPLGRIDLVVPPAQTELLSPSNARVRKLAYDLVIVSPTAEQTTILRGTVRVIGRTTRTI
ncbi:MAG: hypothetical protein NZ518_00055 [Dehalococcoidia bacterium]|nr:hypothetical protein [Dehalococcoidia bacterium]